MSRAVRAGCDVVERAVRRGFGIAGDPSALPPWMAPWAGPWTGSGPWTPGRWVDAMTGALAQWTQWIDAWSPNARPQSTGEPAPAWGASRAAPVAPTAAPALRVTVELRTARAVTLELELAPGVSGGTALEIHGLLAPAAAGAPPITDVAVSLTAGGASVALGSVENHPAASYAGAVLAGGRACGTLTVRLA